MNSPFEPLKELDELLKKFYGIMHALYPGENSEKLLEAYNAWVRYINIAWPIAARLVDEQNRKSSSPIRSKNEQSDML